MKGLALVKKQIDGITGGARADVETEQHADCAIHCGVARQRVALLKPNAIGRRDHDQRDQESGIPAVLSISHLRFSLFAILCGLL